MKKPQRMEMIEYFYEELYDGIVSERMRIRLDLEDYTPYRPHHRIYLEGGRDVRELYEAGVGFPTFTEVLAWHQTHADVALMVEFMSTEEADRD